MTPGNLLLSPLLTFHHVLKHFVLLQWLGKLSFVIVPGLVLLAVLVGAFAAKTYDSVAASYLAP